MTIKRGSPTNVGAPTTLHARRAPVRATSFNSTTGDFSAVIATSTPVRRRDSREEYLEVLSIDSSAIRLDRLRSGAAPILDSHRSASARDQIGVVTDARIEGGALIAEARLSSRDDVKPIASDLATGTPPNVSIGYRVYASEESRDKDGMLIITHTDWEPYEMSLVAIPADPKAHVRKQKGTFMTRTNQNHETLENDDGNESDEHARTNTMSDRQAREAYDMTARAGLPADFARQHIEVGVTMRELRR